jgi:PAS domain S-box-containing protein
MGAIVNLAETSEKHDKISTGDHYLKALLENSYDIIYFKDINSHFTKVSTSFARRKKTTPEEMIGKTDLDLFHTTHAKEALDDEQEIIKTGMPVIGKEEREDWLDGSVTWVSTSKMPLYNDKGEIIGTFGISRDITDIKENEKEVTKILMFEKTISKVSTIFLRHGAEKFQSALPIVLKELSILFQSDRSYVYYCEKNENEFIKREEYQVSSKEGAVQFEIHNFNYWFQTIMAYQTVFDYKGNINSYVGSDELMYLRKNGLSHIIIIPIINHTTLTGFVGFECKNKASIWLNKYKSLFKILSEILSYTFSNYLAEKFRLEAEDELLTLMRAVSQSPSIIIIMDSTCAIEYINPRFTELTGYTFDEVIGTVPGFLKPDVNAKFNPEQFWLDMGNGKIWEEKFQESNKSGKTFWTNITVSPIKNYQDNVTNLIAIVEDITEKMMIDSRKAISQKLESIGQLAAGIAHEINTPMQYIGDNTKFLKDMVSNLSKYLHGIQDIFDSNISIISPQFKDKIEQLKTQYDIEYLLDELPRSIEQTESGISRVTNLIRAMKDFAHPGVKEKTYSNINQGIEVTAEISKNEWKYVADLELNLSGNLPLVYCLQDELNQVVLNMIINSSHAIEEKIGKGNSNKGKITIETYQEDTSAVIVVSDTGAGIKESIISKIFDPFFTTKEVGKGTGQGLAIVHDLIVNKHGGTITVDSNPDTGTKFLIKLPIDLNEGRNNE